MGRSGVFVLVLMVGCGPGATMNAGAVDGAAADLAGCNPLFGTSFFVNAYAQRAEGQGFDLNGDGKQDNVLGRMSSFTNPLWKDSIEMGTSIYLFDFADLKGPPLPDAPAPGVAFYLGVDEADPPDPADNASGSARFLVPSSAFDVNCRSTTVFSSVSVANEEITARRQKLTIVLQGLGSLDFYDVILVGRFSADNTSFTGSIGGEGAPCGLSLTPSPVGSGSMLDITVNLFGIQPDIDLDGDGLEHIKSDGTAVSECVDGDGTVIPGRDCACDPRIVDSFSAAFDFTSVSTLIVGLIADQ